MIRHHRLISVRYMTGQVFMDLRNLFLFLIRASLVSGLLPFHNHILQALTA
jgi:hypothetical protein